MAAKFKVGQVVQLRSGGPEMTVQELYEQGRVRCQWFGGRKLETGVFPEESLIVPTSEAGKKK